MDISIALFIELCSSRCLLTRPIEDLRDPRLSALYRMCIINVPYDSLHFPSHFLSSSDGMMLQKQRLREACARVGDLVMDHANEMWRDE